MTQETLKKMYQLLLTEPHAPTVCAKLEAIAREALTQPEQEPVAFASHGVVNWIADKQFQHEALLYSAPQRTWVGLTEDERNEILINAVHHKWDDRKIVKDIEDKLKEKNNGQ